VTSHGSACRRIGAASGRTLRRLHADRRGNVTLFLLLFAFWMWGLVAAVWNIGATTTRKVQLQTAADSFAYSGASVMARAMNVATGLNELTLRCHSAQAMAIARVVSLPLVDLSIVPCTAWYEFGRRWRMRGTLRGFYGWKILALYFLGGKSALPIYLLEAVEAGFTVYDLNEHVDKFHAEQRRIAAAVPVEIERLRREFERLHGVQIRVAQPGALRAPAAGRREAAGGEGRVRAPFQVASRSHATHPGVTALGIRFLTDGAQATALHDRAGCGLVQGSWRVGQLVGLGAVNAWMVARPRFCVPMGSARLGRLHLEATPDDLTRTAEYGVVAVARSSSPPSWLSMTLLDRPASPSGTMLAVAQAEVFNGADTTPIAVFEALRRLLGSMVGEGGVSMPGVDDALIAALSLKPAWRMWTERGWHWQPRLTRVDGLAQAIEGDRTMRAWFDSMRLTRREVGGADSLVKH
jgi:hypothetical protein